MGPAAGRLSNILCSNIYSTPLFRSHHANVQSLCGSPGMTIHTCFVRAWWHGHPGRAAQHRGSRGFGRFFLRSGVLDPEGLNETARWTERVLQSIRNTTCLGLSDWPFRGGLGLGWHSIYISVSSVVFGYGSGGEWRPINSTTADDM